jgi:hypothetical protein
MSVNSSADAVARIGWDNSEAKKGAEEFLRNAERTKKRAEQILGNIGGGIRFASAFVGIQGLANTAQKSLQELGRGFTFNRTLADSEVGISNVIRRFEGLNKTAAKNEAAKALQRIIELEPVTAGGLQDLVSGFMGTLAAAKGVGLQTMQNVELVAKFANAVANAGLPLDQIRQEFRSILTSTITKDSQIAKILGITNPEMNKLRGDGNAIFEFLTKKLGEFGEAGDSATVTFSSLASAVDRALGENMQPLFELAIKAAKEFTTQLRDPAYVARMQDAGVSIARTASEMGKLLAVAVELAPAATQVAAVVARIVPLMVGVAAANGVMRIQKWIKDKQALTQASEQEAQALKKETAAVEQNTAAHAKNAQAARTAGQARGVGPVKNGVQLVMAPNSIGGMSLVGFQKIGEKGGEEMVRSFRLASSAAFKGSIGRIAESVQGQWLASMNGMSTVVVGSLASMFGDRGRGIAGTIGAGLGGEMGRAIGPSMMDALTFYMSSAGPKGAIAALSLQFADIGFQLGSILGEKIQEASRANRDPYSVELDAGGAMPRIMGMVEVGQFDKAREQLQRDLIETRAKLNDVRNNGTGGAESELGLSNELQQLEYMLKNWTDIVKNSKTVREEEAKAAEESDKAMKKKAKAWLALRELMREIEVKKIDILPDSRKLDALQRQLGGIFTDAGMKATINQDLKWPDGTIAFRDKVNQAGRVHSIEGLQKLADTQRQQGDVAGANATLKALQEALVVAQRIREVTMKMAEESDDQRAKAAKASKEQVSRVADLEERRMEEEILKLKTAALGVDTQAVKAAEDKLEAMRLARQIEDAGLAAGKAALDIAEKRVKAERALSEVLEKQTKERERAEKLQRVKDDLADLEVAELRAKKHNEQADRKQREVDIDRERRRLIDLGVAPDVARRRAISAQETREDLERLAQDPNARLKIRSKRDGTTDAQISEYDRMRKAGYQWKALQTNGLSPTERLQHSDSAWEELQKGMSAWDRLQAAGDAAAGNPQADQAAANAAGPQTGDRIVDAALTRIVKELPGEIARALAEATA